MQHSLKESNGTAAKPAIASVGGSRIASTRGRSRSRPAPTKAKHTGVNTDAVSALANSASKPTKRLQRRLLALQMLGIKLPQLAEIANLSYTAAHGVNAGTLVIGEDRAIKANRQLDRWCKKVARV